MLESFTGIGGKTQYLSKKLTRPKHCVEKTKSKEKMLRRSGGAGSRWMRKISEASEWFQGVEVEDAFLNVARFICMTNFLGYCTI